MPRRPPGSDPKPRGRPPKALADLQPGSIRSRRSRAGEKQPVTAIIVAPPTPTTEPKKRGRPFMPYSKIGKWGQKKRAYRARLTENAAVLLLPLLTAAAAIDEITEQQQEAEDEAHANAEVEPQPSTLIRQITNRDEANDGPKALSRLDAVERCEDESACLMCLMGEDDEAAAAALPYCTTHTRCCGHAMCYACLDVWLGKGGERWPMGRTARA